MVGAVQRGCGKLYIDCLPVHDLPPSRLKNWSALQIRIHTGLGLNAHSLIAPTSKRAASSSKFLVGVVDGSEMK